MPKDALKAAVRLISDRAGLGRLSIRLVAAIPSSQHAGKTPALTKGQAGDDEGCGCRELPIPPAAWETLAVLTGQPGKGRLQNAEGVTMFLVPPRQNRQQQ